MYYNPPAERIDQVEVIKVVDLYSMVHKQWVVLLIILRRDQNDLGGMLKLTGGENRYLSIFSEYGGIKLFGKKSEELQLLYKKGDGFRDNNAFQQLNSTFK